MTMRSWPLSAAMPIGAVLLSFAMIPSPSQGAEDEVRAPLPPTAAPSKMAIPDGFSVKLFAAEPDVVQPIAFTIDPKGRLWVIENMSYPIWLGGPQGKDRILIFEDADGDGRFDRRTVFYDKGTSLTGIELGLGGVWVCSTPNLLFIPDRDGDDKPDAEPEVVLDGWDVKAQHNMFNALKWGPDGWLWGCNGIMSNSNVGRPGAADSERTPINCGVWRYHPARKTFEAVAHGTTNPWGLDFDEVGEAFITNCVIPHLFHVVPGARFQRMYGQDFNTNSYALIETCADHLHWAGGRWTDSREGSGHDKHNAVGGGHAHVGAMIYQGDNWPDSYRGGVYTFNIHGHRVNHDRLERSGSSYVARHNPDLLVADDTWFRGLELKYGPDGAVYFTDWSDRGECHENDADNAHRENGRIYKMAYGTAPPVQVNLAESSSEELARLQLHKNEWYVRTARRLLRDRAVKGENLNAAATVLREMLASYPETSRRLRALWTLHNIEKIDDPGLLALLDDRDESIRSWAVRLLSDQDAPSPAALAKFAAMARGDASPKVMLALASTLQRVPAQDRWPIAEAFADATIDPKDPMLPLMTWYAIEPLADLDPERGVALAVRAKLPIHRIFLARRAVTADLARGLAALMPALEQSSDNIRRDLLAGILDAVRGRKEVPRPEGWPAAFTALIATSDPDVLERTLFLALDFGDPRAIDALRKVAIDGAATIDARIRALTALVDRRAVGLTRELTVLLDEPALRGHAIRALAAFNDDATPRQILDRYEALSEAERADAVATLAARPAWALALLDAIAAQKIARHDLNATIARQLLDFNDPKVSDRLEAVWGAVRKTSGDKAALIAKYKEILDDTNLPNPDHGRGRAIFNRTCVQCHRLFDAGGDVGPDLTGSDRANPDYILENVLDPSAAVAREYTLTNIATADGRLVSGIIREQNDQSVTIQTANERIVLPREDIEEIKPSSVSMMPEGQLENLSKAEIRDLFAYLAARSQAAVSSEK